MQPVRSDNLVQLEEYLLELNANRLFWMVSSHCIVRITVSISINMVDTRELSRNALRIYLVVAAQCLSQRKNLVNLRLFA